MLRVVYPPKRPRFHPQIAKSIRREWPKHLAFLRTQPCVVRGCYNTPVQAAHLRSVARGAGIGMKPGDWNCVSLCFPHHHHQHAIGQWAFEGWYKIDLFALAAELVRRSPDERMKEALREWGLL